MTALQRLAKPVGGVLLALAFALALWAVAKSRADSWSGFLDWIALDVMVGLVVTCGIFLLKFHSRSRFFRISLSIAGAVFVTAFLLWWHVVVAEIPAKQTALRQARVVRYMLDRFKSNHGRFPSQEESLGALVQNPGIENWHGPYLKSSDLIDPWGKPLLYQVVDDKVDVWSVGPDGLNGTDDDIHVQYL
jgi:hypothetical protein